MRSMVKKAIGAGICHFNNRYAKANDKSLTVTFPYFRAISLQIFIIFLENTKLKIVWIKITTFFKQHVSIILWSFSS